MRSKPTEGDTIVGPPAAKQGDKIVGTDIHIIMVPSPGGPVPTPTPSPFNGMITTGLSTDVFIEGKPAATVQSGATNMPPHIPAGGPFQKPPSNQGKIIVGSTGVFINGKPAARQGDTAMTCNDPVDAPTGTVMAVGTVFIGETAAGAPVTPPPPQTTEKKIVKADFGKPGKITSANWDRERAKLDEEVKLIAEVEEFKDGTPARFMIWESGGSQTGFITEIEAEVQGKKIEASWKLSLDDLAGAELKEEQEYYFLVEAEGEEKTSDALMITLELKHADVFEIEDIHFNHDSAVVLPGAIDSLACCYLYAKKNPSMMLLVAGHTDKSGSSTYNQTLSEKRAENALHLLLGHKNDWVKTVSPQDGGKSKIEDYQKILKWISDNWGWSCDPGDADNILGSKTKEAIKTFQETYNQQFDKSIEAKGVMDSDTWGAFFDFYMMMLTEALGYGSDVSRLDDYRTALKFVDDKKIVGCGESHHTTKYSKSLTDRRVEILFFDSENKPELKYHKLCHEGPPDDPESCTPGGAKAKKCELYGKPGVFQKKPITCNIENLVRITLYDLNGEAFTFEGEASYTVLDKDKNVLCEGTVKDGEDILLLSCEGLPSEVRLELDNATFNFNLAADSSMASTKKS
jgi:outer membrane protein OmpA-like peptidoglycan-associated protein/uncharacterized Zn-binding protein involved in type VI secretion